MHLLLVVLVIIVIWKITANPGRPNPTAIRTGLRRLQIVLSAAGALLGGLVGYAASPSHSDNAPGAILLGILIGFTLVWGVMAVLVWIVRGFLAP